MTPQEQIEVTLRAAMVSKNILGLIGMKYKDLALVIIRESAKNLMELKTFIDRTEQ